MVALLTPLRAEMRSTDALRRSSSAISSMAAFRTASRRSSLRGRPRPRLKVIAPVFLAVVGTKVITIRLAVSLPLSVAATQTGRAASDVKLLTILEQGAGGFGSLRPLLYSAAHNKEGRSMGRTIITAIAVAAIGAGLLLAPVATAAPGDCSGVHAGDADCGGHRWNGPLRQTWDTPGYYGGWTGGNQLLCSPFDYQCSGVTSAP